VHFVLDQARLQLIGLSSHEAAEQIQFLLTGAPVTQVREDIRTAEVIARSAGTDRLDPSKLNDMTLMNHWGKAVPLSQVGHIEIRPEEPILKRRDRVPTITGKANRALSVVFPAMIVLMLTVIIFQVRSFSAMFMVIFTAPLGLAGVVPTLLLFHQPFGFNAILGLIALAGILMRNTLILIGQIKTNQEEGLDSYHAVVEATVQRSRPVILTALAAVLAFIPLTFSVFWGSMAYTLIGGTAVGTVLTLIFLPALYSIWFGVKRTEVPSDEAEAALRP
jgi:multidrug efflux pump subunit AcrB